jgi:phosphoglycolate phosphatase
MPDLRLVIWDVDGTLVNSRASILFAMRAAFEACQVDYPGDASALSTVGLSTNVLFARLAPHADPITWRALRDAYRDAYFQRRAHLGARDMAPFYDGAAEVLEALKAQDWTLMAVATGKSRRGLNAMIEAYGLEAHFQSTQTADEHPSKPNPSMILSALTDTGVSPSRSVIIGDTSFDMEMGQAAGVKTIGVTWGYHAVETLDADAIVSDMHAVIPTIDTLLGTAS